MLQGEPRAVHTRLIRFGLIALLTLGVGACSDSTGVERTPSGIELSTTQITLADAESARLTATVLDQSGNAYDQIPAGVEIAWEASDPDVVTVEVEADARHARVTAEGAGQATVTASFGDFAATAEISVEAVPAELLYASGGDQVGYAGQALPDSLVVRVLDRNGRPIPGAEVEFEVTSGGGTVSDAVVTSDVEGFARTMWTLGEAGGANEAIASTADLEAVTFSAIGIEVGTVSGRVLAPNGTTPIPGATVTLEVNGDDGVSASLVALPSTSTLLPVPTTMTDVEGRFTLEGVPVGPQTIIAARDLFVGRIEVDVVANEETETPIVTEASERFAYVAGAFDNIEDIALQIVGDQFPVDRIFAADLSNLARLDQYGWIFINCAASYIATDAVVETLRRYVMQGGRLYVSDMELPLVQAMFPDDILDVMENGHSGLVSAAVHDSSLREDHLGGRGTIEVRYDLFGWMTPSELSDAANVLLRGDVDSSTGPLDDAPLAIELQLGAGRVVFTSFHNSTAATDDQIAVLEHYILGTTGSATALGTSQARTPFSSNPLEHEAAHGHEHRIDWSRFPTLR